MKKIPKRFERLVFAVLAAFFVVSFSSLLRHMITHEFNEEFLARWFAEAANVYVYVVCGIIVFAPVARKITSLIVKDK